MVFNEYLVNDIRDFLIGRGETISVAESVTSGNIQVALSLANEALRFFQGGITVYNLGQKARHLKVEPISANEDNCISFRVTTTMALEVTSFFTSDFGIAITGYASIVPENENEGLFAYTVISYKGTVVISEKIRSFKQKAYEVQVDYTNQVLKLLHGWLYEDKVSKKGIALAQ